MKLEDAQKPTPEGPFDGSPALPAPLSTMLLGDVATAFHEFKLAAADLEGLYKRYTGAQERYRLALAKFTRLAVGDGTQTEPVG